MGIEIERKFLVQGPFPADPDAKTLVQGYIAREDGCTVRVRYDGSGYKLTVKGPSVGIARQEFEWAIAAEDGEPLLHSVCKTRIEKVRHRLPQGDLSWEVDVFSGDNTGLIVAEIELPGPDTPFNTPSWLGREVTQDPRFFNAALLDAPFKGWGVTYEALLQQP
ncbi:MAG: CYTH domain-containing protein [Pseudomonadota bacterium]